MQPNAPITEEHAGGRLRTAWTLFKLTAGEWWAADTSRFAAALAFYTLFSLAPIILIAVGIASLFFVPATAEENIIADVRELAGGQGAFVVKQIIEASNGLGKSTWAIGAGVVTFIFGASVIFGELQAALNAIWGVRLKKEGMFLRIVLNRARSFGIALTAGLLLVLTLIAGVVIGGLQTHSGHFLGGIPWVWQWANEAVSFLVVIVLFAMIYKYLPDVSLGWRDVWMGALVTGVLFAAGKFGIGLYLGHTSMAGIFGTAGSLAMLLVWVYYSAMICFFGAEFTKVHAVWRGKGIAPELHATRIERSSTHHGETSRAEA